MKVSTNIVQLLSNCYSVFIFKNVSDGDRITRAVFRLVWPSILMQSARDRVATAAETVTASRLGSAMSVKQRK